MNTVSPMILFSTPLLLCVAMMLLVPAALTQASRLAGAVTLFGALLLSAAILLITQRSGLLSHFTTADSAIAALMLLATGIAIAPLADRARPASLMLAGPCIAYALLSILFAFGASSAILLPSVIIAITLTALIGSAILPAHPARYTVSGALRGIATAQGISLLGWLMLAFAFVLFTNNADITLTALSAIAAALVTLLTTRAEDGLAKAGEAIAAVALLTCCITLTLPLAVLLGLVSAFCVHHSEAIASALRLDDPQHLTGALLLPAIGGLVLPGLHVTAQLAPALHWLMLSLLSGLALALLVWPLTMLLTGLALPKQRVIQGVRA